MQSKDDCHLFSSAAAAAMHADDAATILQDVHCYWRPS